MHELPWYRPTDHEILGARVIDRTIRPLFPASYFCETQVALGTALRADPMPGCFVDRSCVVCLLAQIVAELLSYAPEVDPETVG